MLPRGSRTLASRWLPSSGCLRSVQRAAMPDGCVRPRDHRPGATAYHPAMADLMDRETAHGFAHEHCLKETTYRHLISVEGVMRSLARRFDEDQELWGVTGLFHDLDQDHTGDDGAQHARLAAEWLREAGVDERVVNGVLAHAYEEYRTDLMSKAVVNADAVAGLLVASALVRPERSAGM